MSSKKIDRALYGPSWIEVILGALLSFALGVVLSGLALVFKPVETVREIPEDAPSDAIYYIEGAKSTTRGRSATVKLDQLRAGQTVSLNEEELNFLATDALTVPDGEEGDSPEVVPNFRIADGRLQIAYPVTLGYSGIERTVLIIATGQLAPVDGGVAFQAESFTIGALQAVRLPALQDLIAGQILSRNPPSEDILGVWNGLTDAGMQEDGTIFLSMR